MALCQIGYVLPYEMSHNDTSTYSHTDKLYGWVDSDWNNFDHFTLSNGLLEDEHIIGLRITKNLSKDIDIFIPNNLKYAVLIHIATHIGEGSEQQINKIVYPGESYHLEIPRRSLSSNLNYVTFLIDQVTVMKQ